MFVPLLCCSNPTLLAPPNHQEDEVTLTLEPELGSPLPTTTQPSPRDTRSPSSVDGPTPGPPALFTPTYPAAAAEPGTEQGPFEVTSYVVQSLEEKDKEAAAAATAVAASGKEESSVVVVATN